MPSNNTDRCYIGIPKWVWNFAVLGTLGAGVTATASWVGGEITMGRTANARQDVEIGSLQQTATAHEKAIDRIDDKLDRILERLK